MNVGKLQKTYGNSGFDIIDLWKYSLKHFARGVRLKRRSFSFLDFYEKSKKMESFPMLSAFYDFW